MPEMKRLLEDYKITPADIENVKIAAPAVVEVKEKIADYHYDRLLTHKETARFFKDEKVLGRARAAFVNWVEELVSGEYTGAYFMKLMRIGGLHVRIGLPAHQVNVQVSYVRKYISDLLCERFSDSPSKAVEIIASLNKVLDMNLDLMTRSYREEELRTNFLSYKLDSWLILLAKKFVNGFNWVLVIGLLVTGVMVLGLAVNDVLHIAEGDVERGVLGTLGTLLMLWVVIELLDTQISHIKGSAFAIKVFVSVALVAELRKILMTSIGHSNWEEQGVLAMSVLILGVVYWLISRVESHA